MSIQNRKNFTKKYIDHLPIPSKGKRTYYYDNKARGLVLAVTSSGAKTFLVYRKVKGRPEKYTIGRYPDLSIEQARGVTGSINAAIVKGENPRLKHSSSKEILFGQLFTQYLERSAKVHKKSWKEDEAQYNRYLKIWQNYLLSAITRSVIQKLHHRVGTQHGPYAANRLLALISCIFNKAVELGLAECANPTIGIKKFKENSRDRFIQADELPRFFQSLAEEHNDHIRDYILLSLLTGARKSNVLSMKWEHVSFIRQEWRISDTKNGTAQTVPLSAEAMIILQRRHISKNADYVFPGIGLSGHLVEPKKGWKRILDRADIQDLRLHDLRRTLGSWQAKTGASTVIIGKSLNHKSPSSTAIYARLDLDPVRASVTRATEAMLLAGGIKKMSMLQSDDKTAHPDEN